ncbi:hypothetical protein [Streptomyces sp. NPDC127084]|uniref:hypothetical protein n=1 Tax=Streptomyces sp. NPDC127084 TaxID=3347133 RepID=UPI003667DA86
MSSDHQQQPYESYGANEPYDPQVTQTWEGRTWDTGYQPQQPLGTPAAPAPLPQQSQHEQQADHEHRAVQEHQAVQATQAAHPLPPETPAPGTSVSTPSSTGYGEPTTRGTARITDAQRARAEGRSPIIPPGIQPAALTAAAGLLLAAAAATGSPYAVLVPLVLLQAVTAAGWFRLNGMWPARQGIALAFAGGLVADAALLAAGRGYAPAAILGTLGVWVLLTLILQLRSHAAPDERMYGLMAAVASSALTILAAGFLAADTDAVLVGGLAVAAATVCRALPLPLPGAADGPGTGAVSLAVAALAAAGAGAVGGALAGLDMLSATLLGIGAGLCALVGLRVASYDYPSRFVHMTAGVALPLTAAAPIVYLLGRVLV